MARKPFNRYDIQVEVGDMRSRWTSRIDMTPLELVSQLRALAQEIEDSAKSTPEGDPRP